MDENLQKARTYLEKYLKANDKSIKEEARNNLQEIINLLDDHSIDLIGDEWNKIVKITKEKKTAKFTKPDNSLALCDPVSAKLMKTEFKNNYQSIDVATGYEHNNNKNEIKTIIGIKINDELLEARLNGLDEAVLNTVITLFDANKERKDLVITSNDFYCFLTGDRRSKITSKMEKLIMNSIRKLTTTYVSINKDNEIRAFNQKEVKQELLEGTLLNATIATATPYCLFHFYRAIPLYVYANSNNQIDRQPLELLKLPIRRGIDVWNMEAFIRRRIIALENNPKLNRNILYENLYDIMEIDKKSKISKNRAREKIHKFLDHYKDHERIKDYTTNKKGIELYSFTIELNIKKTLNNCVPKS